MIPLTEHLHDAIRSGQIACMCPEWTKTAREITHMPSCRWWIYICEIYRLERIAEAAPFARLRGKPGMQHMAGSPPTKTRESLDSSLSGE